MPLPRSTLPVLALALASAHVHAEAVLQDFAGQVDFNKLAGLGK